MKKIFVMLILAAAVIFAGQENIRKVKIYFNSQSDLTQILQANKSIDHYSLEKDNSIIVYMNESEFSQLKSSGAKYEILINDWKNYYRNLPQMTESEKQSVLAKIKTERNISGFGYGSMGGFYTLSEVEAELDSMYAQYPNIITSKFSVGQSIEGRNQWVVKISDNPTVDEDEPEIFFNSLIHAREPAAMMGLIYYMYYLLENYGVDPSVTYLIDNREIFFMPVVNPDGYEYNHQTDPNGGGMWRKNRRTNGDGSKGVDLNRNWGYEWGYNDIGSSPYTTDATYRGTAPFSEPETENIRQFIDGRHFKAALNYHTYSDLLILPWGYIPEETPDSLLFREFASDMTRFNGYTWGISSDIIYEVNGATDDWYYGEQTEKEKIIAMTPEVGSGSDGFWPSQSRIYPLAEENLYPDLYLTWAVGDFVSVSKHNFSQTIINPGDNFELSINLKNKGLGDASNISASIDTDNPFLDVTDNLITVASIPARTEVTDAGVFGISVYETAPVGAEYSAAITVYSNGVVMSVDTVSFYVGTPTAVFYDDAENISDNWQVQSNNNKNWETTSEDYYSSPASFTDSKNSDYLSNCEVKMTTINQIDLSQITNPRLSFQTKWNIEKGWDCGEVQISTNGGSSWTSLGGKYTVPGEGRGAQPSGTPVYDGNQSQWVREEIDLSNYSGSSVKIRFVLSSDEYIEYDGWYVDDIMVFYYAAVPVELNSFTAVKQNNGVLLQWETASELNNYGFEIQKSSDNKEWQTFAFKNGVGTSNEKHNYSFLDDSPMNGISYYRLAQIDYDGAKSFYNSVEVNFTANMKFNLEQNYPNPFNPSTKINYTLNEDGFVSLKVFNSLGQEVAVVVNEFQKGGNHHVNFDTSELKNSLSSGIYIYTLKSNGKSISRKMLLLR